MTNFECIKEADISNMAQILVDCCDMIVSLYGDVGGGSWGDITYSAAIREWLEEESDD